MLSRKRALSGKRRVASRNDSFSNDGTVMGAHYATESDFREAPRSTEIPRLSATWGANPGVLRLKHFQVGDGRALVSVMGESSGSFPLSLCVFGPSRGLSTLACAAGGGSQFGRIVQSRVAIYAIMCFNVLGSGVAGGSRRFVLPACSMKARLANPNWDYPVFVAGFAGMLVACRGDSVLALWVVFLTAAGLLRLRLAQADRLRAEQRALSPTGASSLPSVGSKVSVAKISRNSARTRFAGGDALTTLRRMGARGTIWS